MTELKESQVERQFLLGELAMGTEPGAQQWPEAHHGVDMDLVEAVTVLVMGVTSAWQKSVKRQVV